jgi:hypothetical protein
MTCGEAKFILTAYRTGGQDVMDTLVADALAHLEHDSELRTWFREQLDFDTVVGATLRGIAIPSGLRETIMAGARVSRRCTQPRRWFNWFQ